MADKNRKIAEEVLTAVGGKENICSCSDITDLCYCFLSQSRSVLRIDQ